MWPRGGGGTRARPNGVNIPKVDAGAPHCAPRFRVKRPDPERGQGETSLSIGCAGAPTSPWFRCRTQPNVPSRKPRPSATKVLLSQFSAPPLRVTAVATLISITWPSLVADAISRSPVGSGRVTVSAPSECLWSSIRPCTSARRSGFASAKPTSRRREISPRSSRSIDFANNLTKLTSESGTPRANGLVSRLRGSRVDQRLLDSGRLERSSRSAARPAPPSTCPSRARSQPSAVGRSGCEVGRASCAEEASETRGVGSTCCHRSYAERTRL